MTRQNMRAALDAAANPDTLWLCCGECRRFFQWSDVRDRGAGVHCRCPLPDCDGRDLDYDLLTWDAERHPDDPRWPGHDELRLGMRAPNMVSFHQARESRRRATIVARFARAMERGEGSTTGASLWILEHYLQMQWILVARPGMDYSFQGLDVASAAFGPAFVARHPDKIATVRAADVVATLRAYVEFGERALGHARMGQISWSTLGAMVSHELRVGREHAAAQKRTRTVRARARWSRKRRRRDRREALGA